MSYANVHRLMTAALKEGLLLELVAGEALILRPENDDIGSIQVGDGTNDMDVKWFGGTAAKFLLLDVGNSLVQLDAIDLSLGDSDAIKFGDGTGGDVSVEWNGTYLQATSLTNPMWAACPSRLDPNFAAVAYELFDDFMTYDTTATVGGWVLTSQGTGTPALSDTVEGGVVELITQTGTDNAAHQIASVSAPFKLAAGKKIWFECRVMFTGDATQSEFSVGLCNLAEDLKGVSDVLPQDGISFSKQDGVTAVAATASKNGTDTGAVAGVHTLVTAEWVVLGFLIDGITSITPYVNGVAKTALTATICDDELLHPYFLVRAGDDQATRTLSIDYVRVVQLR